MSKWITKPKVKYAEQYVKAGELPPGVRTEEIEVMLGITYLKTFVMTIHGQKTYVVPGDFIVQEPDGIHYYPCKPDIWLAGHEQLEKCTCDYDGINQTCHLQSCYHFGV